jgi:hypothetical protein
MILSTGLDGRILYGRLRENLLLRKSCPFTVFFSADWEIHCQVRVVGLSSRNLFHGVSYLVGWFVDRLGYELVFEKLPLTF